MAAESLLKDIGEIYARLLDHRPVVQGEVTFMLREFEDKRNEREYHRMQKSLEYAREMSEKLIPDCKESLDANVPVIHSNAKAAVEQCNSLLKNENESTKNQWLNDRRTGRVREWSRFMDDMCERSAAVDEDYESEVKKVTDYYTDLEEKLKIGAI